MDNLGLTNFISQVHLPKVQALKKENKDLKEALLRYSKGLKDSGELARRVLDTVNSQVEL